MTQATALALVKQRDDLIAQIAMERAMIAQNSVSLQRLSRMLGRVRDGIRYLKSHP